MDEATGMLKRAQDFFDRADKVFKDEQIEETVDKFARMYRSKKKDERDTEEITVNKIFPMVRTATASLFHKRPEIITKPRRPRDVRSAEQMELALNYLIRVKKYSVHLLRALRHATMFPYGTIKLGVEKGSGIPWMEAVHPKDVRGDATRQRYKPEDGNFVAFRFVRTMKELRQSGEYVEGELNKLHDTLGRGSAGIETYDEEVTPLSLWEAYVKDRNTIYIVTWANDTKLNLRKDGQTFTNVAGLPVRTLIFNEADDTHYPIALPEIVLDQLKEKNILRSAQVVHSERASRIVGYDINRIPPEERDKFQKNIPLQYIGTDGPPKEVVQPIEHAGLPADTFNTEERVDEDIQEGFGMGSLQTGAQSARPSRSATEAAIVENNLRARSSDRQEYWEEFVESTMQGVGSLMQKHLRDDLWMMITDDIPVRISHQEIQGDFDITVAASSTLPVDRGSEQEKAKMMWEMFSPLAFGPPVPGMPGVKPEWLLRNTLAKLGVKDTAEAMRPAPPMVPPAPMLQPGPAGPPAPDAGQRMGMMGQALQQGSPLSMAAGFRREVNA